MADLKKTDAAATPVTAPLPTAGDAQIKSGMTLRDMMKFGPAKKPIRQVVLPPMPAARSAKVLLLPRPDGAKPIANLTGRRTFIIVCGPQNSSKTVDMRMMASEAKERDRLDAMVFAYVDLWPRTL